MKTNTNSMFKVLYVLAWIILLGLCIEAGGSIFSAFYTLVINPINAATFWVKNDLSGLYHYSSGHFFAETLLISIPSVLKVWMFYLIVKILHDKQLDPAQPFNNSVKLFIFEMSYLAFGIGLFIAWGVEYTKWLVEQGVKMPDTSDLRLGGADVWMFMGVILFVIAQIFKRGIEIQEENDLTV